MFSHLSNQIFILPFFSLKKKSHFLFILMYASHLTNVKMKASFLGRHSTVKVTLDEKGKSGVCLGVKTPEEALNNLELKTYG